MSLARLVVTAVLVEGRSKAEVARTYGISRTWVHELVARYQAEGDTGLQPRSRRPHSNPARVDRAVEDEIVASASSPPTGTCSATSSSIQPATTNHAASNPAPNPATHETMSRDMCSACPATSQEWS